MANSVYFNNCIQEIRHSVYGRDNRKPIADCLENSGKTAIKEYIIPRIPEWRKQCDDINKMLDEAERVHRERVAKFRLSDAEEDNDIYTEPVDDENAILYVMNNRFQCIRIDSRKKMQILEIDIGSAETEFDPENLVLSILEAPGYFQFNDGILNWDFDNIKSIGECILVDSKDDLAEFGNDDYAWRIATSTNDKILKAIKAKNL